MYIGGYNAAGYWLPGMAARQREPHLIAILRFMVCPFQLRKRAISLNLTIEVLAKERGELLYFGLQHTC